MSTADQNVARLNSIARAKKRRKKLKKIADITDVVKSVEGRQKDKKWFDKEIKEGKKYLDEDVTFPPKTSDYIKGRTFKAKQDAKRHVDWMKHQKKGHAKNQRELIEKKAQEIVNKKKKKK